MTLADICLFVYFYFLMVSCWGGKNISISMLVNRLKGLCMCVCIQMSVCTFMCVQDVREREKMCT